MRVLFVCTGSGMRVFYRLADKRIVKLLDDAGKCLKGTLRARVHLVA